MVKQKERPACTCVEKGSKSSSEEKISLNGVRHTFVKQKDDIYERRLLAGSPLQASFSAQFGKSRRAVAASA